MATVASCCCSQSSEKGNSDQQEEINRGLMWKVAVVVVVRKLVSVLFLLAFVSQVDSGCLCGGASAQERPQYEKRKKPEQVWIVANVFTRGIHPSNRTGTKIKSWG